MGNENKSNGRWCGAELVAAFHASGKSRAEYCQEVGITVAKLDYHRYRARQQEPSRLVPVRVTSAGNGHKWTDGILAVGVALRNGRRIELSWQGDESGLHHLLTLLERE